MSEENIITLNQINSLLVKNEFEKALRMINISNLTNAEKNECMGNYHFYMRDFNGAIKFYETAIEQDPSIRLSRYHYLVAVNYERLKNYSDAFNHYVEAIDIDKNFDYPYADLGGMLVKLKYYDQAMKCYRDAIKISPDDITLYLNLKAVLKLSSAYEHKVEINEMDLKIKSLMDKGVKIPKINGW